MEAMNIITALITIYFLFIAVCVGIVFMADSDIMTFLYSKFGKDPKKVYNGKVVWITGASSGIGEALAKELVKHNAKLVLSARRSNELERVKNLCLKINPETKEENILVLPFDMVDCAAHEPCFKKVLYHFGRLDVLISNAGRSQRALWHEIELAVDKELFDLNLFSLVNMNRIVVKYFLQSGGGHLVVNSSVAGVLGIPYSAAYTGSKHALQGYFKGLRNEVRGNNILVTILCPAATFSDVLRHAFTAESGKTFGKQHNSSDKRMTAERCAFLSVAAMTNEVEEAWIGLFPTMVLVYLNSYCPLLSAKLEHLMCKFDYFMKLRDGKNTMKED